MPLRIAGLGCVVGRRLKHLVKTKGLGPDCATTPQRDPEVFFGAKCFCVGRVFFGGLGYQGQKTTHFPETNVWARRGDAPIDPYRAARCIYEVFQPFVGRAISRVISGVIMV